MRLLRVIALMALAIPLAFTSEQPQAATAQGKAAVANCYRECYAFYADHGTEVVQLVYDNLRTRKNYCVHFRHGLLGAMHCGDACAEVWKAYGSHPSKTRLSYKADMNREEAAYRAADCNKDENAPLDDGIEVIGH